MMMLKVVGLVPRPLQALHILLYYVAGQNRIVQYGLDVLRRNS